MQTLITPLITELSMMKAQKGWYTFKVVKNSRKEEIIKAINNQFKVNVVEIRTINNKTERVRTGRKKLLGKSITWKKAMVKLKKNEKISLFEVEQAAK